MRIDAQQMPQTLGFAMSPPEVEPTLSFETLLALSPSEGDAPGTRTSRASSRNVFSFDALGVLGLGGPVATGQTSTMRAEGDGAGALTGKTWHAPQAQPPRPTSSHPTPTGPVTRYVSDPQPATSSIAPAAVDAPAVKAAVPGMAANGAPGIVPSAGSLNAAFGPLSNSPYVSPFPAETGPGPATVAAVARAGNPNVRMIAADEPEEVAAPPKASTTFRLQTEADAPSGRVSVAVSESDGVVSVVAAAPDLTESDRQTLKTIADEAAGDAGFSLGDLRLNGIAIRPSFKAS